MKLRTKLTLGFSLVVLIGVGITGAFLITYSYRSSLTRMKGEQLLLATNRADAIAEEVTEELARLSHLSTLTEVNMTDQNLEPEKAVLRHALHVPQFFALETSAVSPEGVVVWTEPEHAPSSTADVSRTRWFQAARTAHESFVSEEPAGRSAERFRLVVPLVHEGLFAGCLTSVLDASTTTRWFDHLRLDLGPSGSTELIDRGGQTAVSHGGTAVVAIPARATAIQSALAGTSFSGWTTDRNGRDWLLTSVPLPQTGWCLVLTQARDELDDDLDPELATFSLMLVLGLIGALALGLISSRALSLPVTLLAKVAREVEAGHFDAVPPPSRTDEFGDLERAFFSMTATLEAKVRERTVALEKAQALLVEQGRLAAMGKTSAAIAHELKNALNGLGVAVELLTQGKLSPSAQEPIREQVRSEIERLRDITDNLNIFAGSPNLHRHPTDLGELTQRSLRSLADRITSAEVEVKVEIARDLPLVACDGQKVQGIVLNLVKNAVEALEPDLERPPAAGARLAPPQIRIVAREDGSWVELEVADNGPGIAEATVEHMFEPFFTTKRTGTGLGLAIARKVVEAHGGSLTWRANVPRGARLVLRLPKEPAGFAGLPAPEARSA